MAGIPRPFIMASICARCAGGMLFSCSCIMAMAEFIWLLIRSTSALVISTYVLRDSSTVHITCLMPSKMTTSSSVASGSVSSSRGSI